MILPGRIVTLTIVRVNEEGCWLEAAEEEVKLHPDDFKETMSEGDELEVFLYIDENVEKGATTSLPKIQINQVGCYRVVNSGTAGAFVDIGSKRDIVIPTSEQYWNLKAGDKVVFVLKFDFSKKRMYGSTHFTRNFKNLDFDKKVGDQVNAMVVEKLGFGRRLVIENECTGIIFTNDIMRPLRLGDEQKFYIKEIRDREMVLSMQKTGEDSISEAKERILDLLEQHQGYLRLTNDSDPDEIKLRLRISKNSFKKAAGLLSDEGIVTLTKRGIKKVKKES